MTEYQLRDIIEAAIEAKADTFHAFTDDDTEVLVEEEGTDIATAAAHAEQATITAIAHAVYTMPVYQFGLLPRMSDETLQKLPLFGPGIADALRDTLLDDAAALTKSLFEAVDLK